MIKLKPEQEHLLAPVVYCLARAYVSPLKGPIEPFVICKDEKIIGFFWITFTDSNRNCVLCGFRIDRDYQGKGISKKALSLLIQMLKESYPNCDSIQLFVESSNTIAKNLYERFGFETMLLNIDGDLELMIFKLKDDIQIKLISKDCLNDE